jgi:hypothetical protein
LASSETFFRVTSGKTQVGCERETGRGGNKNAETTLVYMGYVWILVTFFSAVTHKIGIFITMGFKS